MPITNLDVKSIISEVEKKMEGKEVKTKEVIKPRVPVSYSKEFRKIQ